LNAAGIQDETGNVLVGVACEADGSDFADKNVANGRVKRVGFVLQARENQIAILKNDAVNRVNFLAEIRTGKFG